MMMKKSTTSTTNSIMNRKLYTILLLSTLLLLFITTTTFVLSNDDQQQQDDDEFGLDNLINDDNDESNNSNSNNNNIIKIQTYEAYQKALIKYRSEYHLITLVSFSEDQERMHQCLHCKLYRDLLKKYVTSFSNEMKGILIEFTPQSQELVIQRLKLTHLPSVTIQSKYTDQLYDCNLKENQLWECVKDAFKQSDMDLYKKLNNFIDMEDIKDLYLKYKNEFEKSSNNQQHSNNGNESNQLFDFSSLKSITKIVLIAFCIVGFVIGISTLQNLLTGSRYMVFILCILTYILCMSGTVFNMIQNPPPYQYNPRENTISFFYPSMRMSFALEGYIATFVIVISSFYFIAIPYYGYYDNNQKNDNSDSNNSSNTTNTTNSSNTSNNKNKKKKKNDKNTTTSTSMDEEMSEIVKENDENNEEKKQDDSHYKSVLKRLFFIWGFFFTFTAAMIFFMIKTSFYLSDTPYQQWVQLLLAIFNH